MIVESNQTSLLPRRKSAGLVALFLLVSLMAAPASGVTLTFREGLNGYTGTQDTYIQQDPANQGTNNGAALDFGWDGDDPASTGFDVDGLIRFDSIFGAGGSQIPLGAEITEATLFLTVFNTGDAGSVRRVLTNWTEASTYSSFCGGGCAEGVAYTPEVGTLTATTATEISVNVTSSVQAWSDGATNFGWIIRPSTGTDGVDVRSSEYATTVTQRPRLVVRFNEGQPPVGNLVREPYLQRLSSSSVTICWRSDVPSDSRVRYGTTQGTLNLSATSATNTVDHIVTINSLTPATRYYYDVGSTTAVQGGGTAAYYFETAPVTGSSTPFRFWAVGDGGNGTATQVNVMNAMLTVAGGNPPDFAVQLGDIAYNSGTDSEFTTNHFTPYAPVLRNTTMWPTLGNHEGASTSSGSPGASTGPYYDAFVLPTAGEAGGMSSGTEAYYSFDYGNAHFVCLNSEQVSRSAAGPMANWLAADLAATTQEWLIVFFHHPPYSRGTHNSDSFSDSGGRMVEMRENILPILEAGGVDLVLAGHSHSYERSYLIDGAQGYGTSPNFPTPNLATLEANGNIIDDGDGRLTGDGAYLKSAGISANEGAVYVVAGHGGQGTGGSINHPVMFYSETVNGSCLIDISGTTLTLQNIRASGVVSDTFTIQKGALPPRVKGTTPPKFAVLSSLASIEVVFTTNVTGVDAADLTVNGVPADSVIQNAGDTYTFMIPSMPGDGNRSIVLAPGGIADAVTPALLFEGDSWSNTINTQPPVVASVTPPQGTNHVVLPSISVMFDKPVVGVTAANLTVNGSPATGLSGVPGTAGPYIFDGYAAPELGTASVILSAGVIQDAEGRPFAGSSWSYIIQGGLVINEFLSSNNTTIADELGGFDDWVEIYNPTNSTIDMSGMYLTDNLGFPTQYEIPSGVTIGPGSYLIFWCDSTPAQGPLHTNFNILRTGEDIGLFDTAANGFALIDGFSFTTQTTDITSGRFPNGTGPITVLATPSPGVSNGGEPPVIDPLPIVEGDTWKYFKGTAEPSTPVASLLWTQVGFDDSSWLQGPSGFGFGDNDDNTTLTDMQNTYASVYTRRLFNISNPGAVTSLTLTVDYDDAFVCYINGAEVARSANIAGTPPLFNTLASAGHEASGGDTSPQPPAVFNLNPAILTSGTNVIAVQGHNQTLASSDFSLITVLEAEISQCQNNGDCNDSNPCTNDVCNMGTCEYTNNSAACDDLNACTTGDTCSGGTCAGTPMSCPMGQVCNPLNGQCESQPVMLMFQDGVSGYDATVDTFIHAGSPTANNAAATVLICDGAPPAADERHVLLRFDNIFGNNIDQIPPGSTIQSATLTVMITNASASGASLYRMTQAWLDTNNWNTFGGNGIQPGTECEAAADVSSFLNATGSHTIDVTASLVAWSAGQPNNGWVWLNNLDDSWQFNSNEFATVGSRPKLSVTFLPPSGCMDAGDCDDGNPCTDDACNMGTCEYTNNADACNDGDLCTTGDTCGGGTCAGTPVNCPMGQTCNPTNGMCESVPTMLTFRDGLNGYTATADTFIRQQSVNQNNGSTADLRWDTEENGANTPQYTLLRFDDIFGAGPNQIPLGSTINSATLTYTVGGDANAIGDSGQLHESLVVWDESTATYANFGGDSGVQTDEYSASVIATLTAATATSLAVDVTASLAAWSASPASNLGWIVIPTNTNGVQVRSSDYVTTPTERPTLSVTFTGPTGCQNDGDCDDGLYCNGVETCNTGTGECQPGPGDPCLPEEFCNETTDTCDECMVNGDCDDGNACNGVETCAAGVCQPGTPLVCDDGNFCNGVETCDPMLGCVPGNDPCLPEEFCNETTDTCDECLVDGDCDDGDACNGAETCLAGVCQPGTPPVCDDGLFCNGLETCDPELGCVAGLPCQPGEQCDEAADLCRQPLMSCQITNPMPSAGGSTSLEVFLSDVLSVRGYETEISIVRTSGTGTVTVGCPGGVAIDDDRPDFIFFGVSNVFPVINCAAKRAAAARLSGGTNVTGAPAYLSEYALTVSPDAAPGSTFEISIVPSPGADLTNPTGQPIPFQVSPPCVLTVVGGCPAPACLTVQITIPGLAAGPVDRDVECTLTRCGSSPVTVIDTVSFTPNAGNGVGELTLTNIDPLTTWVSVREGHTLSRLAAVDFSGDNEDTVSVSLVSGDFQTAAILQDDIVDILDFSILSSRFNTVVTDCMSGDPEDCSLGADVTGDGEQDTADFTALQIYFFQVSDPQDGCPAFAPPGKPGRGPLTQADLKSTSNKTPLAIPRGLGRIGTSRLRAMDASLGSADQNGDGIVDTRDIREFFRQHGIAILPAFELKLRSMEAAEESSQHDSR